MKSIYAIDDNELILHLIQKTLSERHIVKPFQSSLAALEEIKVRPPHLIILDIQMPDMDGYELCSQIKGNDLTKHTPIIMVSAKSGSSSRAMAYKLGAINFLEKPFNIDELRSLVNSILKQTSNNTKEEILTFDDIVFRPTDMFCSDTHNEYKLTRNESIVLESLISRPGQTISREDLASKLSVDDSISFRTVDSHVSSIRKKIKGSTVNISSVYGIGYKLVSLKENKKSA